MLRIATFKVDSSRNRSRRTPNTLAVSHLQVFVRSAANHSRDAEKGNTAFAGLAVCFVIDQRHPQQ